MLMFFFLRTLFYLMGSLQKKVGTFCDDELMIKANDVCLVCEELCGDKISMSVSQGVPSKVESLHTQPRLPQR